MTIEKLGHNYYHIYDVVCGQVIAKTYLYYTKKQALQLFKKEYGQRQRVQRYFEQLKRT